MFFVTFLTNSTLTTNFPNAHSSSFLQAERSETPSQLLYFNWVREYICMIFLCMELLENYFVAIDHMSHKVIPYINVLGLAVISWIFRKMNSYLTVTKHVHFLLHPSNLIKQTF